MSLCFFAFGMNIVSIHMKKSMNRVDSYTEGKGKLQDYRDMTGNKSVFTSYHEVYTAQTQYCFHRVTSCAH